MKDLISKWANSPTTFHMTAAVVSSSHFNERDHDILWGQAIFYDVPSTECIVKIEDLAIKVSPDAQKVLDAFVECGFIYLRISGEIGNVIEGLPTYEW